MSTARDRSAGVVVLYSSRSEPDFSDPGRWARYMADYIAGPRPLSAGLQNLAKEYEALNRLCAMVKAQEERVHQAHMALFEVRG